ALRLAEAVPVRVETRSKSDRGYALAAGDRPAPAKARRIGFEGDETVEQAFERIVRGCIAHCIANEACAAEGRDPEGIHQMRVALRRLRSALSVFRSVLPDDQRAWFASEVKWLTGELGPARDRDVFLSDLLRPIEEALPEDPVLSALRTAVSEARDEDYAKVRAAIASRRYAMLVLRAGAWVEARSWRRQDLSEESARLFAPVRDLADELLEKRHRAVRKRGRRFERLSPEDRHKLRIAVKKLRYTCEFFRSLYDAKPVRRYLKQLAALQDDLGHLNDVSTASKLLDGLTDRAGGPEGAGRCAGAGVVVGWHARGLRELEPELVADWDHFARTAVFWSRKPA
ncbi:MAG TPA: CHAD domain-containing protein, partial [Arenibaculum sp.]|nr:CHAD domain-containing protein [Arenibaculum sp.]